MDTYTYTHTRTIFQAGETAPVATDIAPDPRTAIIPNAFGNLALTNLRVQDGNRHSSITLDLFAEPPILKLRNVDTTVQMGFIDPEGTFQAMGGAHSEFTQTVTGDYAGPHSELFVD